MNSIHELNGLTVLLYKKFVIKEVVDHAGLSEQVKPCLTVFAFLATVKLMPIFQQKI